VEDVVRRAQAGDVLAMAALIEELEPYVGAICRSVVPGGAGEDAMQETFVVVLRQLRSLRSPSAVRGWVRRIAVHEAIRVARRRGLVEPEVGDVAPAREVDLEAALDVRSTLAAMTPEQRAILVLRDMDGLSEAEAARVLQVAPGTVKSRLHRARAAFRERWSA
jgi:RNA polymerase sigma-70 factor (ECF subfamily)